MAKTRTSIPGTKNNRGFTLIELSVVLFLLGLLMWIAVPRVATMGDPGRDGVFRDIASGSEATFDLALFEKREGRLVLDPVEGTYQFRGTEDKNPPGPKPLGSRLTITGIQVDGSDRPMDLVTEIRYLPGGRVSAARIFLRDSGEEGRTTDWTLRFNPFDGTVDVLEGTVVKDA